MYNNKTMSSTFTHLHTHSHYSLLNALPKIPALVENAKKAGMKALALTDDGNMYGAIPFYKECKKQGIKPILGVDFYIALRRRHDKEAGIDNRRYRLVLLAKNENGYKNLIKLVTTSNLEGFYYKPRVDRTLLEQHHTDLVCIIPAFNSELTNPLKVDNLDEAKEKVAWYKNTYGDKNVFLEITHHPEIAGHEELQKKLISLAEKTDTQLVAAHEIYYLKPEDRLARETLLSIQGSIFTERGGFDEAENPDFSFIHPEQIEQYFGHIPAAIENTNHIADMCTVEIPLGQWFFPDIEVPKGSTHEKELRRLVQEGLQNRHIDETKEAQERVAFELNTIITKGYAPYFLVVSDLLQYAHEHGILTTIRGSVAGSLISYLLGITNINPLEYNLPFERFLNPERPLPPDIDMDFADNRRDEMISYARRKYGKNNVAQIGTFGTLMARAAVRDVARALGYDYATGDRIAKMIPFGVQGFPMTIDKALSQEPDLKKQYDTDDATHKIINMARKIEGNARHISVHAAGVVISPFPLDEVVPVQYDTKGDKKLITQYDMHAVEDVGLLKFDFLGLKNLTILADAVKRVKKLYEEKIQIENIPLDDTKTFEMLARGETMGVFQLAGGAMTAFLKELRPTNIHDINAMIALYRPGPMKNIPEYIARKHGKKKVTYYHPKMRTFLDRSYGILVYQDDLLSAALEIAGYTWKNVDTFRKAVGKKIPEEMARQHKIFVQGCMEHSNMTKQQAEGLWELFEPFQGYGFNKAHAASYGRVAYQTAYMKANYPYIYMASLLTADSGDIDRVSEAINECKRMGIEVFPPNVNESLGVFSVVFEKDIEEIPASERPSQTIGIRFGLYSIKNFGTSVADVIIAERKANGPFTSLEDFLLRINDRNLNKKSLEALITCGALDSLGERGAMLANIDDLLTYSRSQAAVSQDQTSLFGLMDDKSSIPTLKLKEAKPATQEEKLVWERELIGLYISGHPLESYQEELDRYNTNLALLKEELEPGMTTILFGVLEDVRNITTKKGDRMAFVRVSDMTDSIEVVIFPKLYAQCKELLDRKGCVKVRGTLSNRGGEISVLADAIKELSKDTAVS